MHFLKNQTRRVISSWKGQSLSIRIIRLWVGVTWVYGGWHKAIDPSFLAASGPTSIADQLEGYSQSSPIGFIFEPVLEHSSIIGISVMVSEFAIGFGTLLWVAPTFFAFSGFAMSIGLWLVATWNVQPYFLGSDTAYAVLWLSYLLALIGGRRKIDLSLDRRGTIRLGLIGALAVAASATGRLLQKSPASSSTTANAGPSGKQIVESSQLAVGANFEFTTASGEPAILFRTAAGVFAYSEICTHQGCTVAYSESEKSLRCPCHGARFDPFNGAAVKNGPATSPLNSIKVTEQSGWIVYA